MRRVFQLSGLSVLLVTGVVSTHAFAEETADTVAQPPADETKAEQPAGNAPAAAAAVDAPASPVEAPAVAAPAVRPKVGDLSVHGYLRGGWGVSSQKGRQTCFQLAIPGSLVSKYRLGNECEVWAELDLATVVYSGGDGVVSTVHFMPTAFVPTTYIGYSPTSTINSPADGTTSTGATLSFPNLYADIKGIPWLSGGTLWGGNRYYKRESIYISDFFYWNPSGVGAGLEDLDLGFISEATRNVKFSYGAFAVDGQPKSADPTAPQLPMQIDMGIRSDFQIRGIRPYESGEFQIGFQYIFDWSDDKKIDPNTGLPGTESNTHPGWGVTVQHVQDLLGGTNKLAVQYGRGGGTGFGTLARFYYPDFSLRQTLSETRLRFVDVLTIQPVEEFGAQVGFVYQHDNLGSEGTTQDWISAGTRLSWSLIEHFKLLSEVGFDRVKKNNGSDPLWMGKLTFAAAFAAARGFWGRPELRAYYTMAKWNDVARRSTVDSGRVYTTLEGKSAGAIAGLQVEAMW